MYGVLQVRLLAGVQASGEVDQAGYHCPRAVLNAADYGVPLLRPRLFVVGTPKGAVLPELPEPTHTLPAHGLSERGTHHCTWLLYPGTVPPL